MLEGIPARRRSPMGLLQDIVDALLSAFNFGTTIPATLSDVTFDGPRSLAAGEAGDFSVSFKIQPGANRFVGVNEGEYEIILMVDENRAFPRGGLIQNDTTRWQGEEDIQELFRIAWDSDQVEQIDWLVRIQSPSGSVFDSRRGVFSVGIRTQ
jgi:hypothetical protein